MSDIQVEGKLYIVGELLVVEYEPNTEQHEQFIHLRLKSSGGNGCIIPESQIESAIRLLQRGQKAIQALT